MIDKITRIYTRRYPDTGQHMLYVDWIDDQGKSGRTEGSIKADAQPFGWHMRALLNRAERAGLKLEHE